MHITRTADYGVRLMTRLAAAPPGARLTVAELAKASHSTIAFTGKIMQRLVAARLVISYRGFEGGFELARSADSITLLDILTALDGTLCINQCVAGGPGCEQAAACGTQAVWARAQDALTAVLGAESLDKLAANAAS